MSRALNAREQFITLRPLTTFSLLPNSSYVSPDASLLIDDDLSFSATRTLKEKNYYELAWCRAEEVALYSSMTIGAHPHGGKVLLFPACWPLHIEDKGQDLSSTEVIEELRDLLQKTITEQHASGRK